jgi:hypothetical protein
MKVHLEDCRDAGAARISIDERAAAGIGAITTRSIRSSIKQRRAIALGALS